MASMGPTLPLGDALPNNDGPGVQVSTASGRAARAAARATPETGAAQSDMAASSPCPSTCHPQSGLCQPPVGDSKSQPGYPANTHRQAHTVVAGKKELADFFRRGRSPRRAGTTDFAASNPGLIYSGLRAGGNTEPSSWLIDGGGSGGGSGGRDRRPGKPLPGLPSLLIHQARCAGSSGHTRSAGRSPIPTQQPRPAPGNNRGSGTTRPECQPLGDASGERSRSNHGRLPTSFRTGHHPTSEHIVDASAPESTDGNGHPSGHIPGLKRLPAPPPAPLKGQLDFAKDIRSATQSIKAKMNYPHGPPPKQRLLPKSRTLAAINTLTAPISLSSLPPSMSSSERKMSSSSRLPIPLAPPVVSASHVPESAPKEISAAQPSPYWTGRFIALEDHLRSTSCLATESLHELLKAKRAAVTSQPKTRPAGISHSNTTMALTTLSQFPSAWSPHLYPKPISVSNPLGNATSRHVSPRESRDEDDVRALAVFTRLESLCVTNEAKQSL